MSSRSHKAAQETIDQFSPAVTHIFYRYVQRMLTKRFNGVRVLGEPPQPVPADRAVIFYSNHPGWYDPLVMLLVSHNFLPDHTAFGPMDSVALEKYGFMKKIGIFGVEQDSPRGAARFLQISRGLLDMPGNALMITPQGEFSDIRKRQVMFKPGLARLAADCGAILQPFASEYIFWNEPRPEMLLNFGPQIDTREQKLSADQWKSRLEALLADAQDELAVASMARDASAFTTIIGGTSGVNPVYDAWRYVKSVLKGQKFSSAHSDIRKDK